MDKKEKIKRILTSVNALISAMRSSGTSAVGEYANLGNYSSFRLFIERYQMLARDAAPLLPETGLLRFYDLDKLKGSDHYTWSQQKQHFDFALTSTLLLKSLLEAEIGFAEDQTQNLKTFIEANLRKGMFSIPEKEVEVQNAVELLLIGRSMSKGTDYDRETGRVKTSGKESIPDFIFRKLSLCLEVKLSTSADKLKKIVDEINSDIRTYATGYDRQLYVVYDLGTIQNEDEFKRHLEDASGVSVLVVKH